MYAHAEVGLQVELHNLCFTAPPPPIPTIRNNRVAAVSQALTCHILMAAKHLRPCEMYGCKHPIYSGKHVYHVADHFVQPTGPADAPLDRGPMHYVDVPGGLCGHVFPFLKAVYDCIFVHLRENGVVESYADLPVEEIRYCARYHNLTFAFVLPSKGSFWCGVFGGCHPQCIGYFRLDMHKCILYKECKHPECVRSIASVRTNTQHIRSEDAHEMPYVMVNIGGAVRRAHAEEGCAFNNQHYGNEYDAEERDEVEALA